MSENPARHLDQAAEAVRAFNHDSRITGPDWEWPGHAYDAIAELSRIAEMLGQAVDQAAVPVTSTFDRGRLRIDGGASADDAMEEFREAHEATRAAAVMLAGAVAQLHNAVSPMGAIVGLPGEE